MSATLGSRIQQLGESLRARVRPLFVVFAVVALSAASGELYAAELTQEEAIEIPAELPAGTRLGFGWTVLSAASHPEYVWLDVEGPAGESEQVEARFDRYSKAPFRTRYFVLRTRTRMSLLLSELADLLPEGKGARERALAACWRYLMAAEAERESAVAAGGRQDKPRAPHPVQSPSLPLDLLVALAAGVFIGLDSWRQRGTGWGSVSG